MTLTDTTGRLIEVETFIDDGGRPMIALVAGPREADVIEFAAEDLTRLLGV